MLPTSLLVFIFSLLLGLVLFVAQGPGLKEPCNFDSTFIECIGNRLISQVEELLSSGEAQVEHEQVKPRRVPSIDGRSFGEGEQAAARLEALLTCLMTKDSQSTGLHEGEVPVCAVFQRPGEEELVSIVPGQPLVIRNVPSAKNVTTDDRWSFDGFLGQLAALPRVCTGITQPESNELSPFFYFDKRRAMFQAARAHWRAPYDVVASMPSSEFLIREDVYFSTPVSSLQAGLNATTIDQLLQLHPFVHSQNPDAANQQAIWAGAAGVTSRLHFDAADNFYLQMSGHKQFYLFPAKHHWAVSSYPFIHPAARQSQFPLEALHPRRRGVSSSTFDNDSTASDTLDFDSDWLDERHPLMRRALDDLLVTTLTPGDLLFLPSFWHHHVTAITKSLSLSVFVREYEKEVVGQIFDQRVPYLNAFSELDGPQQEALLSRFVFDLIDQAAILTPPPAGRDDVQTLVHREYDRTCDPRNDYCFLDQKGWLSALVYTRWRLLDLDPMIGSAAPELTRQRTNFACWDTDVLDTVPHFVHSELSNFVAQLAPKFRLLDRPVRHIVLGDYVELLVSSVVPTADVHAYLVHCSAQKQPLP